MAGVLTDLRRLRPARKLSLADALSVAELQAGRLLTLRGISDASEAPIPEELIAHLPRFVVRRYPLGTISGLAHWDSGRWCIALNSSEPRVRQRFSLAHELGHVLEAPFDAFADTDNVETIADHFAACLLMPRTWVKKLWGERMQDTRRLARHFDVSTVAMERRLNDLRLRTECDDDAEPVPTRHGGQRTILRDITEGAA